MNQIQSGKVFMNIKPVIVWESIYDIKPDIVWESIYDIKPDIVW